MKPERNSSFELLRLLCIYGIIVMHIWGSIDSAMTPANTAWHVLANSIGNVGVTCFVLISGYFGIRFDLKKLIRLDLMVIFFTLLGTLALGDFGVKALIKACIPVISRQYWFITCYFALCILAPFLNQIPERLSRGSFRNLLLVLLLLFSVIPTFTTYDIMQDAGKGLAHFVMIYLLGRYLALYHGNAGYRRGRLVSGFLLSTAIIFALDGTLTFLHDGVVYGTFARDCSLFIIASAVLLVLCFSQMHFTNRVINRAAGDVLAVYVLDSFIRALLERAVDLSTYLTEWYLPFLVLGYAVVVVVTAILLNEVRRLTIGRIEPWLSGILAAVWDKIQTVLLAVANRLLGVFLQKR
ncbi:MAG: acyltransferase family protein [Roseburia sp.]|nr:acyltransferase family protein [Roseburia sp.]